MTVLSTFEMKKGKGKDGLKSREERKRKITTFLPMDY